MPRLVLCACVDIGSNTTRLLVAEPGPSGLREVLAERCFTRLGRGTGPDGSIDPAKLAEIAEVVCGQVRAAREVGRNVGEAAPLGTHAGRAGDRPG